MIIKYPGGTDTAGAAEEIPTDAYPTPDILRLSGGVGTVNILVVSAQGFFILGSYRGIHLW